MADPVVDFDTERLLQLDRRIDEHDSEAHRHPTEALRDRWEFGHLMLGKRRGKKLVPGYLDEVASLTLKSRAEIQYRMQYAQRHPTNEALSNAIRQWPSWNQTVNNGGLKSRTAKRADASERPTRSVALEPGSLFSTFVVDPPWRYGNTSTRGAAENHYETMSIEDLCALDVVPTHAADQAHLYLWTTSGHLPDAFQVMAAWGFEYKAYLVWVKPQMGMGNYFRISTELVLFGIKGGMRTQHRGLMNYFDYRRAKHSAKPPAFHTDIVEKASPGPYLELFTRCSADTSDADDRMLHSCPCSKCRLGWTVWGDQS